jgi:hypothetical protein
MADDRSEGASIQDLRALDRDVARGVALLAGWRSALRADPAAHADEEPLDAVRHVTGQSTWLALERLDVSEADRPLREALRRWVYHLLQARIGRSEEAEWASAAARTVIVARGEDRVDASWPESWRGAVDASTAAGARPWLEAAAELGPPLASVAARRASRRVEVAKRLGFAHPSAPLVAVPYAVLRETATRFLSATDDLWSSLQRAAARDDGLAGAIVAAVARDAGEGWPARLTWASLRDLVRPAFEGPPLELPPLPPARGASSFARALRELGYAVRSAHPSSSVPFALACEPAFVAAHRLGFVMGALPIDPLFQSRVLGLSIRVAGAQSRVLACMALFDARLHAIRILLCADAAPAPRDLFDELTARTFGRAIDARFQGAWPAGREDEPARWLALLEAVRQHADLRDRFDADWFRNPRAWKELRAPTLAREVADESAARAGADDLSRAFEGALG